MCLRYLKNYVKFSHRDTDCIDNGHVCFCVNRGRPNGQNGRTVRTKRDRFENVNRRGEGRTRRVSQSVPSPRQDKTNKSPATKIRI